MNSQCRFCELKMLYMFKTFVFLLSGHASYVDIFAVWLVFLASIQVFSFI